MALVPAGDFIMGGSADRAVEECKKFISVCDRTTFEDEEPAHSVYLSDFYIDVYQVTNTQYAECVDEGVCELPGCTYYKDSESGSYPVVCTSWYQAQAYCEWRGARLPTEAEWEKAARGGLEGMQYPWGDEMPVCDTGAENGAQFGFCEGYIMPVGSYSPNGYGLYDMAGNVWEWVGDWYEAKFYHRSQAKDPPGPALGEMKVLRGGSWGLNAWSVRTPDRFWNSPDYRFLTIGFRCADSISD